MHHLLHMHLNAETWTHVKALAHLFAETWTRVTR